MKARILTCAAVGVAVALTLWPARQEPPFAPPPLIQIPHGTVAWAPLGNFSHAGKAGTPRPVTVAVPSFEIMKYQVSRRQYRACVADQVCAAAPGTGTGNSTDSALPQTQVNWQDATTFATWYSERTGENWRLPTETEWQLAAAERWGDAEADRSELDPGDRMLARYERGLLLRGTATSRLRPAGGFGENSFGLADVAGNVWEWTNGCVWSGRLRADGLVLDPETYCGVRIAGGLHRAAVVDFIRDASVGGCAVGLPPDHLGFRLVRQN
ncbi:formylglycine-generating enzyme family protein [Epibacterium sp. Ofav1-8]|uniref:formylglycine-generating enzyme family protein n=1 Tax=Epibacterium sp. Ofav1-8 TaxID=2917735 RepID=UPI001EF40B1E|nr:SUMF1/EgtB/PvdO family nonheme iron enzyme [Epibacterium sp. Ofav1-8]MCG7622178.1 formylglycine-generating enzyme family protein [Epibacterium sp. Ofav1-8]